MKILIVGLGLMGGSYAMALKKKGYFVSAITRSRSSVDFALKKGIIDKGSDEVIPETVNSADVVIFALYPHVFMEWIENYQQYFKPGAIIPDVPGVMGAVDYGVKNADDSIFKKANFIVVPTGKNTESAVEFCKSLGTELGFWKITALSPEAHDEMIAFLSQLTHCIAVALMNSSDNPNLSDYTGDSFRDLTRIAKINEDMWSELFLLNKEALLKEMDVFLAKMVKLRNFLALEDAEGMYEMMRISTLRREKFDN